MDMDSTKHASGGFCVGEQALSRPGGEFISWGQESNEDGIWMFTTQDGRLNSGWYRSPGASMLATGELVNYRNSTRRIYMDLDIEYVQVYSSLTSQGSFRLIGITGKASRSFRRSHSAREHQRLQGSGRFSCTSRPRAFSLEPYRAKDETGPRRIPIPTEFVVPILAIFL
jgi:hypothetical protein